MSHMKAVNSKSQVSSTQEKKILSISLILYLYEMTDIH